MLRSFIVKQFSRWNSYILNVKKWDVWDSKPDSIYIMVLFIEDTFVNKNYIFNLKYRSSILINVLIKRKRDVILSKYSNQLLVCFLLNKKKTFEVVYIA